MVWIGDRLPWFARLAVESAIVAMPSTTVTLHSVITHPEGRHVRALERFPQFERRVWPLRSIFERCPGGAEPWLALLERTSGAPAAVSNLVRLAVLERFGGVYLDTDTIVVAPLDDPDLVGPYVGTELVWECNRRRVNGEMRVRDVVGAAPWAVSRWIQFADARLVGGRLGLADRWHPGLRLQVNNAVIGAPAHSPFLVDALRRAERVEQPAARFALGPSLLDDAARERPDLVTMLDPARFYAIPPGQSRRWFDDVTLRLPEQAQVIHYVASNHAELLDSLETDARLRTHPAVFWREARRVLAAADRLAPPRQPRPARLARPTRPLVGVAR